MDDEYCLNKHSRLELNTKVEKHFLKAQQTVEIEEVIDNAAVIQFKFAVNCIVHVVLALRCIEIIRMV